MPSPISLSPSDSTIQRRKQLESAPAIQTQKAAERRVAQQHERDGFEKKPIEKRRATDGDAFDGSANASQKTTPPVARPDGQGPKQTTAPAGVEGGRRTTDTFRAGKTSSPSDDSLGALSKKYESGNRGPGTASGGQGDAGGVSYGTYQMTSKTKGKAGGTASEFVGSLKSSHPEYYQQLAGKTPGSAAFTKAWKDLAAKDPKGFAAAQHDFIKKTHYDPAKTAVEKATGIDFDKRSKTLKDVLWSTADQHRTGTAQIFKKALAGRDPSKMTDEQIISAVYKERGRTNANGSLVHFPHNSTKVQASVARRFRNEAQDALTALRREKTAAAA